MESLSSKHTLTKLAGYLHASTCGHALDVDGRDVSIQPFDDAKTIIMTNASNDSGYGANCNHNDDILFMAAMLIDQNETESTDEED